MPNTPKRDPREPTPGAPGLSSAEFEKMMEELEAGIQQGRKKKKPLSVDSALEAQKPEGITSPSAALRRTAAERAMRKKSE